MASLIEHAV
jgi:hypothetical protein